MNAKCQNIINRFDLYFSNEQRLNRKRFIYGHLAAFFATLFIATLFFSCRFFSSAPTAPLPFAPSLLKVIGLGLFVQDFVMSLKAVSFILTALSVLLTFGRLRDLSLAWYWVFLYILPAINLFFFFYLCCKKGKEAENEAGFSLHGLTDAQTLLVPRRPLSPKSCAHYLFCCQGSLARRPFFWRNFLLFCVTTCLILGLGAILVSIFSLGLIAKSAYLISGFSLGFGYLLALTSCASCLSLIIALAHICASFWQVQRWHDLKKSGAFFLLTLIPYLFLIGLPEGGFFLFFLKLLLALWLFCTLAYLFFISSK